jgi:group I intron endonuclease
MIAVYQILNKKTKKIYVGSSVDVEHRWKNHLKQLKKQKHHSILLQRAFNKYGEKSFSFNVLEEVFDKSKLIEKEQQYLDNLNPSYNVCKIAGNTLGYRFRLSEETKRRMSEARKGPGNPNFGKSHKGKRNPMFGKRHSEDAKRKMSEIKRGSNNPFYGKHISEEHRQAIKSNKTRARRNK